MIHSFKFGDRYIALDVESGAVHELDAVAYDVVCALERSGDPYALGHDARDVDEILRELEELRRAGEWDAPESELPGWSADGGIIKSLCLHVAHDCNLRCKYCFASAGDFHGERMLMDSATGRNALDFLIAHSGGRRRLEVDLFGGEPLMNFDVVKDIVAYGRELERIHDKQIDFTITTNAVALDDEMIEFINAEMANVVISLDGRREVHDALRPTVNGRGSFDIIAEKAKKMIASRGDKEYYVRGTFTRNNLDFTEDVRALRDMGFTQISLEPVVLGEDSPYALLEEHVGRVLQEYEALAEFLLESRAGSKWFNFFHFMVDFDGGPCLKKRVKGCGAGVEYAAITPDGDIYPCHQFVGETEYRLGNVRDGVLDEAKREQFARCNILTKPMCAGCWAKYFCAGGCAANAYKYNGAIDRPYEMTCAFERKRAELAIGIHVRESGAQ
ncbi:MAG: thioether cross-link-forming SCIFF peptide maturase [Clostridia bacterium]|nr:thioether cross-link-forming SCIFF peptide maturase [Clostridia bacterium]